MPPHLVLFVCTASRDEHLPLPAPVCVTQYETVRVTVKGDCAKLPSTGYKLAQIAQSALVGEVWMWK